MGTNMRGAGGMEWKEPAYLRKDRFNLRRPRRVITKAVTYLNAQIFLELATTHRLPPAFLA